MTEDKRCREHDRARDVVWEVDGKIPLLVRALGLKAKRGARR